MRLRNTMDDYEYDAELTTEHAASNHALPVLVDLRTNEAVDRFSMATTVIITATDDERHALREAGYWPAGV